MAIDQEAIVPAAAAGGTEATRFNALRHGVLSRYTVLPWEDAEEYRGILEALVAEHLPKGPTEEHFVEEIAGVLWRKRRLRLAEAASHRRGLKGRLAPHNDTVKAALVHLDAVEQTERVVDAVRATADDTQAEVREHIEAERAVREALDMLNSQRNDAYEAALRMLHDGTRDWWEEAVAGEDANAPEGTSPPSPDPDGLRQFLEDSVLPWFDSRAKELSNRPLIREQAFGEALDPDKLERLGRYEVHLDRKLERMLSMLLRLKELRKAEAPG